MRGTPWWPGAATPVFYKRREPGSRAVLHVLASADGRSWKFQQYTDTAQVAKAWRLARGNFASGPPHLGQLPTVLESTCEVPREPRREHPARRGKCPSGPPGHVRAPDPRLGGRPRGPARDGSRCGRRPIAFPWPGGGALLSHHRRLRRRPRHGRPTFPSAWLGPTRLRFERLQHRAARNARALWAFVRDTRRLGAGLDPLHGLQRRALRRLLRPLRLANVIGRSLPTASAVGVPGRV